MIELYNLDSKGFEALRKDMVEAIPHHTKDWTNFNPSDPGITLIELLCFVADTLLYRTNRIPDASYLNRLRLVAGATENEIDERLAQLTDSAQKIIYPVFDKTQYILYIDEPFITYLQYLKDLEKNDSQTVLEMQQAMLKFWQLPFRTITADDFNQLAIRMTAGVKTIKGNTGNSQGTIPPPAQIVRTSIDSDQNKITVVLISGISFVYVKDSKDIKKNTTVYWRITDDDKQNSEQLSKLVDTYTQYTTPRLLTGTIFFAQAPIFTSTYLEVDLQKQTFAETNELIIQTEKALTRFLDPIHGGIQGDGWPYNQPVTPELIQHLVQSLPGVKRTRNVCVNQAMSLGKRATIGLDTYLGNDPNHAISDREFKGLPRLEQLIIRVSG